MLYALESMARMVFNWAKALLSVFKEQLTKCQQGELKQFGYGTILESLFFEMVPHLRLHVAFTELRS